MAITIPTYDAVVAAALAFFRNRFAGRDLSTESFLGKLSRAEAMLFFQLMQAITAADNDSVPTTKSSTAALDAWAVAVGVPGSIVGTYGRKVASTALGARGTITGTNATSYADGSLLTASDGSTTFRMNNAGAALTIAGSPPGTGSATGTFDAVTAGTVGNVSVGAVLTWSNPPSGSDGTVTVTTVPSTLGIDIESNQALLTRIQNKMQSPPKGGTSADYRSWAESQSGVARAYPYPLRGGLGTLHLVLTGVGSGKTRGTGSAMTTAKTNVDNYINGSSTTAGQRTVTSQGYTSILPYFVGTGLKIRCRMVPSASKFNFDWADNSSPLTVATGGYAAGPPATITVNEALPANLTAAVDAGLKPRIQLLNTNSTAAGWVATPYQIAVTAYNAGLKKLTLDTLPSSWVAPSNGDTIYAGGPMVSTIASAILAYIDGLGSSRAGTYADTIDTWEDTASIARITQIALDATDSTSGSRFAKNIVTSGITVAYNGGGAGTLDIVASDTTANGPELLYCLTIAVTA